MKYCCGICLKNIKAKNTYKHFKSKSHLEFDKCKHIILSHKDIDMNDVYEAISLYIVEHNKKFDYHLVKCEFKIVFKDYQYFPSVTSKLSDNKTLITWKNFLEKVIDDFKDKGYNFNQIAEMQIMTTANKLDMSYDFYIKHNMHAVERSLNALINKHKTLNNKLDRYWRHPFSRKLKSRHV